MFGSRFLILIAVLLGAGVAQIDAAAVRAEDAGQESGAAAAQGTPATGQSETETPRPRAPLRLNSVDYQDAGESGKLTIAGVALPGKEVYLFLDNQPLVTVAPDESGQWKLEQDVKLGEGRHTLRADQYDADTNMLAARAMVSIERAKPDAGQTPKQTTP